MKFGNLLLVHIGLSVHSALVTELLNQRLKMNLLKTYCKTSKGNQHGFYESLFLSELSVSSCFIYTRGCILKEDQASFINGTFHYSLSADRLLEI